MFKCSNVYSYCLHQERPNNRRMHKFNQCKISNQLVINFNNENMILIYNNVLKYLDIRDLAYHSLEVGTKIKAKLPVKILMSEL